MADELKRIYVAYPDQPGSGAFFTGDNAEKEAQELRDAMGITESKAASPDEDKAAPKAENKARS